MKFFNLVFILFFITLTGCSQKNGNYMNYNKLTKEEENVINKDNLIAINFVLWRWDIIFLLYVCEQ